MLQQEEETRLGENLFIELVKLWILENLFASWDQRTDDFTFRLTGQDG